MIIGITGEEKGRILITKALIHKLEKPICIIDLDPNNRNLEIAFQIENEVVYDILDYLKGDCSLYQSTLEIEEGIELIPSSYVKNKYIVEEEDLLKLNEELKEEYTSILYFKEEGSLLENLMDQWIIVETDENRDGFSGESYFIGNPSQGKESLYIGKIKNKDNLYRELKNKNFEEEPSLQEIIRRFIEKERAKVSFLDRLFGR